MKNIFYFGEQKPEFAVRVLNERELRAGAGILFFFSMLAMMNVMLLGNFYVIKIFIIAFLVDFIIRLFINPKYAPSLILGRLAVAGQRPEYVGAPQKKFAWSIGLVLAVFMFFTAVIGGAAGLLTCAVCLVCLTLLFFESAFGICVGCKVYNLFHKNKAQLCPGGVCEVVKKEEIQKISSAQIIIAIFFVAAVVWLSFKGGNLLSSPSRTQTVPSCFQTTDKTSPCGAMMNHQVKTDEALCPVSDFLGK